MNVQVNFSFASVCDPVAIHHGLSLDFFVDLISQVIVFRQFFKVHGFCRVISWTLT